MRILGVVGLLLVFCVVWFCFAPFYLLADLGDWVDRALDKKINDLFAGICDD